MVILDGKGYPVCCGRLGGAALAREVLGESQSGICVKFDVVGAAALALFVRRPRDVEAAGDLLSAILLLYVLVSLKAYI